MNKSNILPTLAFIISFALPFLVIWYKIEYMPFVWAGASICLFGGAFTLYQTALVMWELREIGNMKTMFVVTLLVASAASLAFSLTVQSFLNSLH